MSTQTLPRLSEVSSKVYDHPFLEALTHVEYGAISIITPEGEILEFKASSPGPKAFLQLQDWKVLDDLLARGELGFADAYIDGRCESSDLPQLLTFALVNSASLERFFHGRPFYALWLRFRDLLNNNSLKGGRRNVTAHYDLGNDFYSLWLDKSMTYSGALFEGKDRTLEEAQQAKYQRIIDKLAAKPGDHILEIGCGWGGFAEAAAKQGLRVTAITLSEEQAGYANARLHKEGLDSLARIQLGDYRQMQGKFDHIVSIGMFEHVGERYWPAYFKVLDRCLKPEGKAMVQTITIDDKLFEELRGTTGFIEHYIFPGGMLPSKFRFNEAANKAGLLCKEMFGFGDDYAQTVRHWLKHFEGHLREVRDLGYDQVFIRLWRFYLASCIASFTSHRTDVMQAEIRHLPIKKA